MSVNALKAAYTSLTAPRVNHLEKLYDDAYRSCAAFLPCKDVIALTNSCFKFFLLEYTVTDLVTNLDLDGLNVTDKNIDEVFPLYPKFTSLRLGKAELLGPGILKLAQVLHEKPMVRIVLDDSRFLSYFPLEGIRLIQQINFIVLEQLHISTKIKDECLNEQVFEAVVTQLPSCQALTSLRLKLLPQQLQRLIPQLPPTMTELHEWHISDEIATAMIAKDFKNLKRCTLKFDDAATTAKMRELLQHLPLSAMHQISFSGYEFCKNRSLVAHVFMQISLNTELRSLHLWIYEKGHETESFQSLLESIHSHKLEDLSANVIEEKIKTFTNYRKKRIKLLNEHKPSWSNIQRIRIWDNHDRAFSTDLITLDSLTKK